MHMYGDVAWFVLASASGWVDNRMTLVFFEEFPLWAPVQCWISGCKNSCLYPRTWWWFAGFTGMIQISSRKASLPKPGVMAAPWKNLWDQNQRCDNLGCFFLTDWGSLGWICLGKVFFFTGVGIPWNEHLPIKRTTIWESPIFWGGSLGFRQTTRHHGWPTFFVTSKLAMQGCSPSKKHMCWLISQKSTTNCRLNIQSSHGREILVKPS